MIHILNRLLIVFIFSVGVSSCTENTRYTQNKQPIPITPPSIDMAEPRGINADMMTAHIAQLMDETRIIQNRVQLLLDRLSNIKNEIAYYDPDAYQQIIEIAGQEREITLPVPERPKQNVEHPLQIVPTIEQPKPVAKSAVVPVDKKIMKTGVVDIRTGVHSDKTRIVLDINGDTSHEFEFDRDANVLTVNLNNASWNTAMADTMKSSQFNGYQAKNMGQGSMVAMSVKNTQSVQISTIKKTGDKPARLIIDLMK